MTCFLSLIILMFLSVATPSFATNYWVSASDGISGDCSTAVGETDPGIYLRSIADGLACVGPAGSELGAGHAVIVKDGVYNETLLNQIPSGASQDRPFTLMAQHVGGAVLRPTTPAGSIIYIGTDTHFLTISGLVLDGINLLSNGLDFSSYSATAFHDIRVNQVEVKNIDGQGMMFGNGTNFTIDHNWVHDGGACGQGQYLGYCHGMYMGSNFQNSVVDGNVIDHYQGYAIHFYDGFAGTITGNVVRNNNVHQNGSASMGEGSILVWGPNNQIYTNVSYANAGPGFNIAYSGNFIHDNVAWVNGDSGIVDISGGNAIVNNTLIENAGGPITVYGSSSVDSNITTGTGADYFVNAAAGNFTRIQ